MQRILSRQGLIPAVGPYELHRLVKEPAEVYVCEQVGFAAVRNDLPFFEQDHSINLRWNFVQMVGDEDDCLALVNLRTHEV